MSKFKVGDREDETVKPAKPEPNTFSLDEFKRVGYAVTQLGTTVKFVAHVPDAMEPAQRVVVMVNRVISTRCEDGRATTVYDGDDFDLVAIKRPTVTINGVEVPAPEKAALAEDTEYWSARAYTGEPIAMEWIGSTEDHNALKNGTIWLAEADARAALDAMLKPLREYARGG